MKATTKILIAYADEEEQTKHDRSGIGGKERSTCGKDQSKTKRRYCSIEREIAQKFTKKTNPGIITGLAMMRTFFFCQFRTDGNFQSFPKQKKESRNGHGSQTV